MRRPAYIEVHRKWVRGCGRDGGIRADNGIMKAKPKPTFRMMADRPFFLSSADSSTDTILFMGAIEDPTA